MVLPDIESMVAPRDRTSTVQGVALLGATGSIGASALRVLGRHRDRFRLNAVTANANAEMLREIVSTWTPRFVGLVDETGGGDTSWQCGPDCLVQAATREDVDIVINAIVGAAGLPATLAALERGKRVALANKETLVVAGDIVMRAARTGNGSIVPVDSEHSAILQCLAGHATSEVRRLVLTASGGPFRTWSRERIAAATVDDALQHPTWRMGSKITVDSASLANKALEIIEAHHLFDIDFDRIQVVVHPQSIVHSFVEFVDGSVLAQLGVPSMELPILYALTWPERLEDDGVLPFDPVTHGPLSFEPVRHEDFPMLDLGIAAGRKGGSAPAVYNAANEAAVASFLDGRLGFSEIAEVVSAAVETLGGRADTLDELLIADLEARRFVNSSSRR